MARSEYFLGIGIAFPSGALPAEAEMKPPAAMIVSRKVKSLPVVDAHGVVRARQEIIVLLVVDRRRVNGVVRVFAAPKLERPNVRDW